MRRPLKTREKEGALKIVCKGEVVQLFQLRSGSLPYLGTS